MTTNSELAILSLLAEHPRHGYDIEQIIEERGMRNWTEIGFSSIYYLLNKLERAGMISSRMESSSGKGPARKVYTLTETGQTDWKHAVLRVLTQPEPYHLSIQIGLSSLPLISTWEARAALTTYLQTLQERFDALGAMQSNPRQPLPYQVNAMFGLSLSLIEAEIHWLKNLLQELSE